MRGVQAGVNGLIPEGILQSQAFVVAITARAVPLNPDVGIGLENGLSTMKHAIVKEILVNVCIELCLFVVIFL